MYVARNLAYNKNGNIQFLHVECLPIYLCYRHLISYEIKCHFFITKTSKVKSSKMSDM